MDESARNPAGHLKGHQWQKGQSGNPGGRPKGKSVSAALRALAKSQHNGRPLTALLAERLMKEALAGKFHFLKEAVERLEGKVETAADAAARTPPPPHRYVTVILEGPRRDEEDAAPPPPALPAPDERENVRVVPP